MNLSDAAVAESQETLSHFYYSCHNQLVKRHVNFVRETTLARAGYKKQEGVIYQKV